MRASRFGKRLIGTVMLIGNGVDVGVMVEEKSSGSKRKSEWGSGRWLAEVKRVRAKTAGIS